MRRLLARIRARRRAWRHPTTGTRYVPVLSRDLTPKEIPVRTSEVRSQPEGIVLGHTVLDGTTVLGAGAPSHWRYDLTPEQHANCERLAADLAAASVTYVCPAISQVDSGRVMLPASATTCPWCRRPLTEHERV